MNYYLQCLQIVVYEVQNTENMKGVQQKLRTYEYLTIFFYMNNNVQYLYLFFYCSCCIISSEIYIP